MKYIGIDMGSTFTKAVLLDLDRGAVLSHNSRPSPQRLASKPLLHYEVPAAILVENVKALIDDFAAEYDDIAGLVLSTQMHGFIYSVPGREDVYISWQDMRCTEQMPGRGESYLAWLQTQITPGDMADHGVYLKPALAMCNLYTLLHQEPSLPADGRLYTLGSYVIRALTGNNICHAGNAAPLGLLDVRHHRWDRALAERLGLGQIELPALAESDYLCCGEYVSGNNRIRVFPDYGDTQVSALGSELRDRDVFINLGTGAQVIRFTKTFDVGEYEIRPYFEHTYLNTISNMPGGRNLNVLIRFLRDAAAEITGTNVSEADVWAHIAPAPDAQLRVQTGFYQNPFFPDGGAITGITQNNLDLHTLFAAAYRDMAETYWRFIHELGGSAEEIGRVVCGGGVSWKNPDLVRTIASVTGRPTVLSPIREEVLNGLYQISMVCAGRSAGLFRDKPDTVRCGDQEKGVKAC